MTRSPRAKVLARIADRLAAHDPGHPLRVAVDGVTAAGKSTFAAELAVALGHRGRPVVHLSMDGFHHPRAHRYRQGRGSAVGYLEDAYDFPTLVRDTLIPLGSGGDLRFRRRSLDLATDVVIGNDDVDRPVLLLLGGASV